MSEYRKPTMWEVRRNRPQSTVCGKDFIGSDGVFKRGQFNSHLGCNIFGFLAETAGPILRHYHSDLYHDALFIQHLVDEWDLKEPVEFYWGVRDTGTSISHDPDWCDNCEVWFRCSLFSEPKPWGNTMIFDMVRQ